MVWMSNRSLHLSGISKILNRKGIMRFELIVQDLPGASTGREKTVDMIIVIWHAI